VYLRGGTLERWRIRFISVLNRHPGMPSEELDNEAASATEDTSVSNDEASLNDVYAAIAYQTPTGTL